MGTTIIYDTTMPRCFYRYHVLYGGFHRATFKFHSFGCEIIYSRWYRAWAYTRYETFSDYGILMTADIEGIKFGRFIAIQIGVVMLYIYWDASRISRGFEFIAPLTWASYPASLSRHKFAVSVRRQYRRHDFFQISLMHYLPLLSRYYIRWCVIMSAQYRNRRMQFTYASLWMHIWFIDCDIGIDEQSWELIFYFVSLLHIDEQAYRAELSPDFSLSFHCTVTHNIYSILYRGE